MGVAEEDLAHSVRAFSRDDETLLNAMKVMEFGMVDSEERSPTTAMLMSGGLFLGGSVPSVAPFLFDVSPHVGLAIAAGLAAIALFGVGVVKTFITRTNPLVAGIENLAIAALGGAVAYGVGRVVGVAL